MERKIIATIRAVAEAAGVSKTTVSFVMNDTRPQVDRIPEETRERIKACAATLGYSSNAASIRTGKRVWVGVMTEVLPSDPVLWPSSPFFHVSFLYGVQRKLADNGYFTILALRSLENEVQDMALLASARIGGLILRSADAPAVKKAEELLSVGVPVINVFPREKSDLFPYSVDLDNIRAGAVAAELVIKSGLKNPACVTVAKSRPALLDRQTGMVETIQRELGVATGVCELPIANGGDPPKVDEKKAFGVIEAFIRANRPDALVALDGGASLILSLALDKLPVRVPQDISVIGFDAFLTGNSKYRKLSSVGVSWLNAGEVAASVIVDLVERGETSHQLPKLLSPVFVPGDTTVPGLSHEVAIDELSSLITYADR
jgi:LacI family transcriptional regulator